MLFVKHKCGYLWRMVEKFNSLLFYLRYKDKLKSLQNLIVEINQYPSYKVEILRKEDMLVLSAFFAKQPEEYFVYFNPHKFDYESLVQKNKDKSFIMLGVKDNNNQLIGYGFLRCFFNGKSFRGKIVDVNHQGKGIAKFLGMAMTSVAEVLNLRLFATISKNNLKSIASSKAVNNILIINELPNDYLYVEYLKK